MTLPTDKRKGIKPEDYLDFERRFLKVSDDENHENAAQDSYLIASPLGKEEGYGYHGRKQHWNHHSESRCIDFNELVKLLEKKALEIEKSHIGVAGIRVMSIDFTLSAQFTCTFYKVRG